MSAYPELDAARAAWQYVPPANALAGHTVLVTGAGDGIGAALARTAAIYGAHVVLLGRTRRKLEAVFDWIEAHTDTNPVIVPCDLEQLDEAAAERLRDSIGDTYGALHGLVNNASILGPRVPLEHYPEAAWRSVMQVNANAPFVLIRTLFPLLDACDDACVINVSSSVGRAGRAYWGAYSASKFALEGLTQILADETEMAGRIRAYSVNPGGTRTAMRRAAYPAEAPGDVPPPESHMDLFLYLLEGPRAGKPVHETGTPFDARDWAPRAD